ncbi:hypothetical protein Q1695_004216 [Nippostrongylus brasiliensis]|nr:hypothetical protein Q1695_004216 [Nippostrongylus brasiliensis]
MAPSYIRQLPTMLLKFFSVALLVASCVSQKGVKRPGFAEQFPETCTGKERDINYSRIMLSLFALVNQARHSIATGKTVQDVQKSGKPRLMYGVRYSCGLEVNASTLLEAGETVLPPYVVLSFNSTQDSSLSGKIVDVFRQMKKDSSARTMLTSPYVPYFGCAHSYKPSQPLRMLCVFKSDAEENPSGHNRPCSNNEDCKKYQGSTCSNQLCWVPSA